MYKFLMQHKCVCCVTFCLVQLQMASYLGRAHPKQQYAPLKRTIMYVARGVEAYVLMNIQKRQVHCVASLTQDARNTIRTGRKPGAEPFESRISTMEVSYASSSFPVRFEHSRAESESESRCDRRSVGQSVLVKLSTV
jgi:hypothetical protein